MAGKICDTLLTCNHGSILAGLGQVFQSPWKSLLPTGMMLVITQHIDYLYMSLASTLTGLPSESLDSQEAHTGRDCHFGCSPI
jgi:hypothetical protein